jgi:osmotically-inducible protein OsmY
MKIMNTKLLSALCVTALSFPLVSSAMSPKSQFLRDEAVGTKECCTSQRGPIDRFQTQSDRTITESIRKAIYNDSSLDNAYNQVTISTVKGQVTLNGAVATQREKDSLWQKARETVARKQITNNVVLGGVSSVTSNDTFSTRERGPIDRFETQSDRKITQSIRDAIYNDSSLDNVYNQITISTVKGYVTLNGQVTSLTEKNSIWSKARAVVESKKIDNDLVVIHS